MSSQVITIKVDPTTKKEAQHAAEELGLSLSAVLKGFLKQFIRTKTVTFSAREQEIPNAHTLKVLKKAEENYKKGNTSPAFTNIEDELKWLEKQGI
jgi:addiction module RelB/DinJ family antitoxin